LELSFNAFFQDYLKFFFILTPFFVMSVFLVMAKEMDSRSRTVLAVRVTVAVVAITIVMFWFGHAIFNVFGITIDAFRIGAGVMLFLSAVSLVQGKIDKSQPENKEEIAVVPLALPITVGPGTIGVILVRSSVIETFSMKLMVCGSLIAAVLTIGVMLVASSHIERIIGQKGLSILSKITGLFVASIAAQLIFTGIRNFFIVQ